MGLPLPVPIPSGDLGSLQPESVSCTSPGDCTAVGFYAISTSGLNSVGQEGVTIGEVGGTWSAPQTVPSLVALDAGNGVGVIPSVSCPAPGYCAAVGLYANDSGMQAAVLSETSGTWGTAQPISSAPGLTVGESISCGAVIYCSVGGGYSADGQHYQGIVADETPPPSPSAVAVGAEGSDGQLWVQAPQLGRGWHALGGKLIAPPAVAAAPNPDGSTPAQPLFIATSSNNKLYIRSLTAGWQLLGPATATCAGGPAAVIADGTLTVACRGLNNSALWENSAAVPTSGLPRFTHGWTSLGGVLTASPAAAPVGGVMTFFAPSTGGRIWTRTLSTGYTVTPWLCIGAPAAAAQAASGDTIFACQGGSHALYVATNGGAGWSSAVSLGGSLIAGPGVAATSQVPELLAEGPYQAVWERTSLTGWASLGGVVVGGVGAVALN